MAEYVGMLALDVMLVTVVIKFGPTLKIVLHVMITGFPRDFILLLPSNIVSLFSYV
jgi:hypothetical protein